MKEPKLYSPRILVVDDEQAILNEFQEILCPAIDSGELEHKLEDRGAKLFGKTCLRPSAASFELVLCHQGDEAVEKVRAGVEENKPFAVAFLDVRMPPGPNGVWTAEHIRALDADIQIVIVTAYSDVDPLDISRRVSPTDKLLYIQKPFHPHEIRQFASALGAKWLAERQLRKQAAELERSNEQLRHEVEEHKRTEQKRQLLSHAIMSTDDSVYITDMENKIVFVNKAFCETYGYEEEEVIGKDGNIVWKETHPSTDTRKNFRAVSGWEVGFYHKRKDGSEFPVSLSRSVIKDENGNEIALVGIARSISERILAEDELRTANQKLAKQNRLKSEFDTVVSEELSASLIALKDIICDAMKGAPGRISPRLQENLELAEKDINRLRRIVGDFFDISKIDARKMKLELTELNLCSVVSEVVGALSPFAAERHIELESFLPDSELVVNADRNRIMQALTNLINNAIESTPSNGRISVRAKDIGNRIAVEVEDNGPSIESNETDKIFSRFAQIKKQVHSGKEKDFALGLPIAKELVEMHGGCIWAQSGDGQGNNLCFTLPKAGIQEEVSLEVKAGEGLYGNCTRQ